MAFASRDDLLAKKTKKSTVRVRQKNNQEKKLLDYRLDCIDYDKIKKSNILDKYIRSMQVQVYGAPLDAFNTTPLTRPTSIDSFAVDSRPYSAFSLGKESESISSRPGTSLSGIDMELELRAALNKGESASECRFGTFPGHCTHFPCCIPESYNSFSNTADKQLSPRAKLLEGRVATPAVVLRPETACSVKTTISSRERALRTMVKDMRQRNDRVKPVDINTKYGTPLSLRKILKPVRPSY